MAVLEFCGVVVYVLYKVVGLWFGFGGVVYC